MIVADLIMGSASETVPLLLLVFITFVTSFYAANHRKKPGLVRKRPWGMGLVVHFQKENKDEKALFG